MSEYVGLGDLAFFKTLEEGARIPVRLALGELGSEGDSDGGIDDSSFEGGARISGKYFGNDSVSGRGWGTAREW